MNSNIFIILNLITFVVLSNLYKILIQKGYSCFISIMATTLIYISVLVSFNQINTENLVCNKGNHIMDPDVERVYGDRNKANLPQTEIGSTVCKYPFDPRYIPRMNKKWCLRNVLN
jgi:hypothetical protein